MTGETALVEVTSSKIASNITNAEIDGLPSQGRNQLSLMQLVPGLTPNLKSRIVCGRSVRRANGQATTANLFLVDGAYDNDDRRGGSQGTQARVTLYTMAEYQVLVGLFTFPPPMPSSGQTTHLSESLPDSGGRSASE